MKVKITQVQQQVLREMLMNPAPSFRPRATLERLAKKGFVAGDKHTGWVLTEKGRIWVRVNLP